MQSQWFCMQTERQRQESLELSGCRVEDKSWVSSVSSVLFLKTLWLLHTTYSPFLREPQKPKKMITLQPMPSLKTRRTKMNKMRNTHSSCRFEGSLREPSRMLQVKDLMISFNQASIYGQRAGFLKRLLVTAPCPVQRSFGR